MPDAMIAPPATSRPDAERVAPPQPELAALQAERDALARRLDAERSQRTDLEAVHRQAVQALHDDYARQWAERDALPASFEEELAALDGRYRELSDEMRRVQAVADAALRRCRERESELAAATQACVELQARRGEAQAALDASRHALAEALDARGELQVRAERLEGEVRALQGEREAMLRSTSWRATAGLRRILVAARRG